MTNNSKIDKLNLPKRNLKTLLQAMDALILLKPKTLLRIFFMATNAMLM